MKAFGYKKNSENLLKLEEVSIECSLKELEKIIDFLSEVKRKHSTVENQTDMCHSHYKDWDLEWKKNELDLIVVTKFEKK